MGILESFANALSALLANKLRSLLTMLGVIIGVGAIITTTSIGEGAKADITERIQTLGANILAVRPGQSMFRGRSSADCTQNAHCRRHGGTPRTRTEFRLCYP